jgi:amino-acid N-acetyltransferase
VTGTVMATDIPRLLAFPLLPVERAGLAAALRRANLRADDLDAPGRRFWRFEDADGIPVGFGGLEIHGKDALMRSIVTLPPVRSRGFGKAIATALETEAAIAGCNRIWLIADKEKRLFEQLGYSGCQPDVVPRSIAATDEFTSRTGKTVIAMTKRLG